MTDTTKKSARSPWFWIPSLYFAEGIPYAMVMLISVVMYKRMGISNAAIALYTSWLYLPWVIKPLWSPIVDILKTKRWWIVVMQVLIGAGLGGVALTIPMPGFFKLTLGFFWLLAFSSATHDIAADGFYMLGLSKHQQTWFVGIRSTFYRLALITVQGFLIMFAGYVESHSGLPATAITISTDPLLDRSLPAIETVLMDATTATPQIVLMAESQMATIPRQPEAVEALLNSVREWNAGGKPDLPTTASATESKVDQPGFWSRFIVDPLERFLSRNFGPDEVVSSSKQAGNVELIYVTLSAPPADKQAVVVNLGRQAGDKNLNLIEGSRMVFSAENWNRPQLAVIQADPKLKTAVAAEFEARAGNIPLAWSITFVILAGLFIVFFIYHRWILPYPASDLEHHEETAVNFFRDFLKVFAEFFRKEKILLFVAFLLLYRLGEAQLVKIAPLFMLDVQEVGGLALTTGQYGFIYGTLGLAMLTVGGIIGGLVAARNGLKTWIWWMAIAINLPDVVYIYMSSVQPDNFLVISLCVAIEQLGYGFGFTAYMLFMIYASEGLHKTAHFAICTGFMALGMMIPGMFSGWLQEIIGYQNFFIWVMIATIPGFILLYFLPIDPEFGKKKQE
ncbi:MAG: MFS transporter [Candidatus Neomarinimicrobiota bacterium]